MKPAAIAPEMLERFPELAKVAQDILVLGHSYASLEILPVKQGDLHVHGLSWRCRAIANANLLRGEELLRFSVLALNEGAMITAYTLTRSMFETLAAVVFTRLKIERGIRSEDPVALADSLNRLTCGNRYMAARKVGHLESYNVLTMIDDAGAYLDREYLPEELKASKGSFRDEYDLKSEFVHPAQGSFKAYQRWLDGEFRFSRGKMDKVEFVSQALSALRMAGHHLILESCALHAVCDLPPDWPSSKASS